MEDELDESPDQYADEGDEKPSQIVNSSSLSSGACCKARSGVCVYYTFIFFVRIKNDAFEFNIFMTLFVLIVATANRREKSLGTLTENFIKLFLTTDVSPSIPLSQ